MVGPPAPAPASPPSSSPPGLRSPRLDRSRSGDRQPPHPPDVPLQASPSTSSPPGGRSARRGGDHQHPHPPDAPLEATPGSASSAPGRRSGSRGRRSGGDRQPQPQPPPPPAAAVAFQASVPPRRSFRISLRSHVRVLPLEKPAVTRKTRDPARPRGPSIETLVSEWAKEKAASGATQEECILPFLQTGAPKKVECLICSKSIVPGDSMLCAVRRCQNLLHKDCSKRSSGCCPRHMCFYCKKKPTWHHVKHTMPACTDCSLQQNRMVDSVDLSKIMVSWSLWPSTSEDAGPADGIEEAFRRLPLPYIDQEFNIDPIKKEELDNGTDPPPYVHLKHNAYLVKNKCDDDSIQGGCTNCDPAFTCKLGCSCRSLSISCSPACHCSVKCTNRPFRREKKIEIVKTQHCGWGARALEAIEKGDFVIEFVGEDSSNISVLQ
ncbi:hypothetical protein ABZP36_025686 [Zizania latifolia]